jgi:CTP synthase (UTP-ammonia lyase)
LSIASIAGDFDRRKHSHWATEAALFHAGASVGVTLEPCWISTPSLAGGQAAQRLGPFDAIWGAPGSPYASMEGIVAAIRYARERDVPYLGTCAGFQYALIELSRHVLGIRDADSAENDSQSDNVVITPVYCATPNATGSAPRLAGAGIARPQPGTLLEALCGAGDLAEEYFCSFEVNATFVPRWPAAGIVIGARGVDGEVRSLELPNRRFFLATLFQPQLSSSFERPHPIIEGFVRASVGRSAEPAPVSG